jgi:hypothetical protein
MRADFYRALQFSCLPIRRSVPVMTPSSGRTSRESPQVMTGIGGIADR